MVNIEQIKEVCDELNGNCSACPFASKEGCPFLSNDPLDWDVSYINERFINSPLNKVVSNYETQIADEMDFLRQRIEFEEKSYIVAQLHLWSRRLRLLALSKEISEVTNKLGR